MNEMKIGELFGVTGYDEIARITSYECGDTLVVLNNNSTHYLVAVLLPDIPGKGQLLDKFSYHDEHDARRAYTRAVHQMAMESTLR